MICSMRFISCFHTHSKYRWKICILAYLSPLVPYPKSSGKTSKTLDGVKSYSRWVRVPQDLRSAVKMQLCIFVHLSTQTLCVWRLAGWKQVSYLPLTLWLNTFFPQRIQSSLPWVCYGYEPWHQQRHWFDLRYVETDGKMYSLSKVFCFCSYVI